MNNVKAVYQIKNTINNKVYVGSSCDVYHRWHTHKHRLNNNEHHSPYLQASWNKYGSENFIFEIVEEIEEQSQLIIAEQKWIEKTKCYEKCNGYNVSRIAGSRFGVGQTEETKTKISNAFKKEKHHFWGKHLSPEHKMKISISNKGKVAWNKNKSASVEQKEKMKHIRALQVNGPRPQQTKEKISRTLMNHPVSEETREKLRVANTGKKMSQQTKEKLSRIRKENPTYAKLTIEQVEKIKELCYDKTYTQQQIATLFNVSQSTISAIKNNKLWSR